MELAVEIPVSESVVLVGRHAEGHRPGAAAISHPHPLYGGSMDNNVVCAARDALAELGLSTLRFNFRGTGGSTGTHGDGVEEISDIRAAVRFLRKQHGDDTPIHLVGYSFGASVTLRTVNEGLVPTTLTLISPPLDFMAFGDLALPDLPTLLMVGGRDDYCSVASLQRWVGEIGPDRQLVVAKGADHFWFGMERRVREGLTQFMRIVAQI